MVRRPRASSFCATAGPTPRIVESGRCKSSVSMETGERAPAFNERIRRLRHRHVRSETCDFAGERFQQCLAPVEPFAVKGASGSNDPFQAGRVVGREGESARGVSRPGEHLTEALQGRQRAFGSLGEAQRALNRSEGPPQSFMHWLTIRSGLSQRSLLPRRRR